MHTMTDDDWRDIRGSHPLYLALGLALLGLGLATYLPARAALWTLEKLS